MDMGDEPGEDFSKNGYTWNPERITDTDIEYISLDALAEGKAENELTAWFLVNLLRRPAMAEHIAKALVDRGYGLDVSAARMADGSHPWSKAFGKDYSADGAAGGENQTAVDMGGAKVVFVGDNFIYLSPAGGAAGGGPEGFGVGDIVVTNEFSESDGYMPILMNQFVGKEGCILFVGHDLCVVHDLFWPPHAITLVKKAAAKSVSEVEMVDGRLKLNKNEWAPYAETEAGKKFWEERKKAAADAGGEIRGGDGLLIAMIDDAIIKYPVQPLSFTPGSPQPHTIPNDPTTPSFNPNFCICGRPVDTTTSNLITGIPFDYLLCDECYQNEPK